MNGSRSYANRSQSYVDDSGSYVAGTPTFITYVEVTSMDEKATRVMEKDSPREWKDSFGDFEPVHPISPFIPA